MKMKNYKEESNRAFENLFKQSFSESLKDFTEVFVVILVFIGISIFLKDIFNFQDFSILMICVFLILSYLDVIPIGLSSISPMKRRNEKKLKEFQRADLTYLLSEIFIKDKKVN